MIRTVNTRYEKIHLKRKYKTLYDMKPNGLWYSLGDEWVKWVEREMPYWKKCNNINLEIDTADILFIKNAKNLIDFADKYSKEMIKDSDIYFIDWDKVKKDFKGIEVHNYFTIKYSIPYRAAMKLVWFSAWDVSSGCIWDLSAIKSYKTYLGRDKKK